MSNKISMYDPFTIKRLSIKNRLVHSAMFEFGADHGRMRPEVFSLYEELAKGGCGLIITGMHAVCPTGGMAPSMIEATYDDYEEDLRKIVKTAHHYGSKLFVQLNHCGYRTDWQSGYDRMGVSELTHPEEKVTYHEMNLKEIQKLVVDFTKAALRCKNAGCDGIQVHSSHGFLLNTFLSPLFNHRKDAFGGSIENRSRLLRIICSTIRAFVGEDYPIAVKLPFSDLMEPTTTPDEIVWLSKELEKIGVDFIEVTSGIVMDGGPYSMSPLGARCQEGHFLEGAKRIAQAVDIPVSSVCGYRTPDYIESVLNTTKIKACSLGRPLVREPDLPNRWRTDRSKAKCISCNRCFSCEGILRCQIK